MAAGQAHARLRICHVNFARGFRGGERQTELLIRELVDLGIPQRLVARRGEALARKLRGTNGLDLREVNAPFLFSAGLARDHIVHAHEARAVHFASLCKSLVGSSYLLTRRINRLPSDHYFTRRVYRRADAVVAVAHAVAQGLREYEPALAPHVIHSAVSRLTTDAAVAARLRAKWPGKFLVGHAGALDNSQKGQIYLIRAARRLLATQPQIQFVLLGDGPDASWFRQEAASLPNVSFEGYVTNVGDYMSIFDLFVLPSIHEGIGGILLDAMNFGVPVVASAVDGLPEIVHDGSNGLLIPPADENRLADAVERLYREPQTRDRMGAEGRRVAADYTPGHMARRYLEIYSGIEAAAEKNA